LTPNMGLKPPFGHQKDGFKGDIGILADNDDIGIGIFGDLINFDPHVICKWPAWRRFELIP